MSSPSSPKARTTSPFTSWRTSIDASVAAQPGLDQLIGAAAARCDVSVNRLIYDTRDPQDNDAEASAGVLIPSGCTGPFPILVYHHGTTVLKSDTMSDPANGEMGLQMAMYAAQGYAVVATDYLGYAQSSYPYHPYMHADSEASSMVDSIRAARNAATALGLPLNGKVMVTGYSQGGHASMAAQRAIERDDGGEIDLVAAAPVSYTHLTLPTSDLV